MAIAVIYSAIYPQKPPSRDYVNGTYRNQDCGTITFRDGNVEFGSTNIPYTLELQKNVVSAISPHLIGIERDNSGCRIVYDPSAYPVYLPFGHETPPTSVQLWDLSQNSVYDFVRKSEKSRSAQILAKP